MADSPGRPIWVAGRPRHSKKWEAIEVDHWARGGNIARRSSGLESPWESPSKIRYRTGFITYNEAVKSWRSWKVLVFFLLVAFWGIWVLLVRSI